MHVNFKENESSLHSGGVLSFWAETGIERLDIVKEVKLGEMYMRSPY